MNSHESGELLALQAETEVEHQALIRLRGILDVPAARLPTPTWDLPVLERDGLDASSDRAALIIPAGGEQ